MAMKYRFKGLFFRFIRKNQLQPPTIDLTNKKIKSIAPNNLHGSPTQTEARTRPPDFILSTIGNDWMVGATCKFSSHHWRCSTGCWKSCCRSEAWTWSQCHCQIQMSSQFVQQKHHFHNNQVVWEQPSTAPTLAPAHADMCTEIWDQQKFYHADAEMSFDPSSQFAWSLWDRKTTTFHSESCSFWDAFSDWESGNSLELLSAPKFHESQKCHHPHALTLHSTSCQTHSWASVVQKIEAFLKMHNAEILKFWK